MAITFNPWSPVSAWQAAALFTDQQTQVICRIYDHLATPALGALAQHESIYKTVKFSDHAPITIDYDFSL